MVRFKVDCFVYEIGSPDFLHSLFSTVAVVLEDGNWGSRFPVLMNELYQGSLEPEHIDAAMEELGTIISAFEELPPDRAVWDIEDLEKQPPWGDSIPADADSLLQYFRNRDGDEFLLLLRAALKTGKKFNEPVTISTL